MKQFTRTGLRNGEPERMIAACEDPFARSAVGLLFETGLRLDELSRVKRQDVDWSDRRLRVLGKGRKYRVCPLSDAALGYLKEWLEVPKPKGKFALHRAIQRAFTRAGVLAGLDRHVHVHLARHTWAVRALRRGISLRAVQLMMGHSSIAVTQAYLNLAPDDVCAEFAEKWEGR